MTDRERHEEAQRVKRYEASQRRRVAAHATMYGWRDGTTEVETAGLLVVAAVALSVVAHVPALAAFKTLRIEAVGVLLALLVVGVEVLATGFRFHVSQGVGGLVGSPRVERSHLLAGAVGLALALAVLALSISAWSDDPSSGIPIGVIAGIIGVLGAGLGALRGTQRIVIAAVATALVGLTWDRVLGGGAFAGVHGFALGLLALATVPLVSGVVGFHQYRREVSDRHDEYVADAIALLRSPKPGLRAIAAEALGCLGGLEVAGPLLAAVNDPDEDVRLAAAFALGEIRELVPARLVARRLDLRGYGPEDSVPASVLEEVAQLGRLEWQDVLAEHYRELAKRDGILRGLMAVTGPEQPPPVRRVATRVLAETRERAAIEHLVALLADEHPEVRAAARGALAWTGSTGAQAVAALLADRRDELRREGAATLLGLLRYAEDAEDTRVQQELRDGRLPEATERAGDPARDFQLVAAIAEEAFSCAVCDRDEMVREAAALALDLLHEASGAAR